MSNPITRRATHRGSATIANGGTKTGVIDVSSMGGGVFKIPSGWDGGASVTFEICSNPLDASEFGALHDASDGVVTQPVTAGKWYEFPEGVMKSGAVKIVAASAVGADREIVYELKA